LPQGRDRCRESPNHITNIMPTYLLLRSSNRIELHSSGLEDVVTQIYIDQVQVPLPPHICFLLEPKPSPLFTSPRLSLTPKVNPKITPHKCAKINLPTNAKSSQIVQKFFLNNQAPDQNSYVQRTKEIP
jgi:hypothetical protein